MSMLPLWNRIPSVCILHSFLSAAGKYRLHSMVSLVAASVHASALSTLQKDIFWSSSSGFFSGYSGYIPLSSHLDHTILP